MKLTISIPWRPRRFRRPSLRVVLAAVLVADTLFVAAVLGGLLTGDVARANETGDDATTPPRTVDTLRTLGEELAERRRELERRELELAEALRGGEVLRLAGITPVTAEPATEPQAVEDPPGGAAASDSFKRLQKAYENMEPESAATAIAALAGRDSEVVVELLLGWPPRTSGAILDALTQTDPAIAADLSYEIWKRSGGAR